MCLPLAKRLVIAGLVSLSSCHEPGVAENFRGNCSDEKAVKCSVLHRVISPSRDFEVVTKIDSYGGAFGTEYDSADVYISRVGTKNADTLLFSIEDNGDDLSNRNFVVSWTSPSKIKICYGHGNVTFQVIKFADKTISAIRDANLDRTGQQ